MHGKGSTVLRLLTSVTLLGLLGFGNAFAQEQTASRGRRVGASPAAEATVTVNEQFLNSFLTAIFDNLNEPAMPLTIGGASSTAQCRSEIRLKRETGGVRTAVHFEEGRIVGPLAFAGAYSSTLMGCIEFSGWADSEVKLEFDSTRRALLARFQLRDIHLNNTPAALNGPLLNMVQGASDRPLWCFRSRMSQGPVATARGSVTYSDRIRPLKTEGGPQCERKNSCLPPR